MNDNQNFPMPGRRKFIQNIATVAGSTLLVSSPLFSFADRLLSAKQVTVGEIMDDFIKQVPGAAIANTVDTLKSGNREILVTGVVTCMFPTIAVIKQAIKLGANFIIAHEPTFYNHADAIQWLETDNVYKYKAELLAKNNIAVWRNHDYIHSIHPDGVRKPLVEKLGWQKYGDLDQAVYTLTPALSLKSLIAELKTKLQLPSVRYVGDLDQSCKKVLLMPGAAGTRQITALGKNKPDVLVTGEVSEWETAEYIRDARESGQQLSMIILGHIASEEWGSQYMADWMKKQFPEIKTTFIRNSASLKMI
ncbi:Nif3-like dinuclear metal center hexameric protein [Pedobacter duraquae]|uniref:Putative NIF3 family GTP cyclohydrolase 1 type 2 n=1 Tax=Pedobacter duraquae TaxID=425511 RepID=A0A4R6IEI5_9SPHI|nr:Nif3-like dinuclear metal center hexameric protein [Pedobacter duraquae]TDO19325.1 putative NIF3 family GTP cyclohydrolase 1 type 2 [Pedobacter duraquae]